VRLLTNYINSPGHCRLCNSSVTPVIDTFRDYDSDGLGGCLYICMNCVTEIADLSGWASPSVKEDLEHELAERGDLIDRLEVESADLAAELATLKDAFTVLTPKADEPAKRGPGRPRKVV